ncbi:helix-turn-helix domain-containing protein [Pseudophaeobacter leonis]|uniref:helix-turn-helix domain-containing protein n=1 Tax=Pseudophaeobacter leonis TaxID=1144477 RepID=UPI0009F71789|nr:helix-turn-helix domain-containing protein [Pseudophaeobacter leonis]
MSKAISIDPARGFVALPASIFDLEISPGAFRALSVLCNLSDPQGYSWASLEQLAEWVHRARSSVSSYLVELRAAGLVSTETQTRSNGANYRLKIKVLFWSKWVQARKKCASPAPQKTERSIQPAERPTKVKHKPIKTHHSEPAASELIKKVYKAWKGLTSGVTYGQFSGAASPALMKDSEKILATSQPPAPVPIEGIASRLKDLWGGLGVTVSISELSEMVMRCKNNSFSEGQLDALESEIQAVWKGHWKKPPATKQFATMLSSAKNAVSADTMLRLIEHDFRQYRKLHA